MNSHFKFDTNNDTDTIQPQDQKIEVSSKLIEKICLHFNTIIEEHKKKTFSQKEDIFTDHSSPILSMETTLKSIIGYLLLEPSNSLAAEINATLIYLLKNINIFVRKNNPLTEKNISNITKISFMLSHKTLVDEPVTLKDYALLLYTVPALEPLEQLENLDESEFDKLVKLDQKKLATLERAFLNAIDHELYFPTKELISIYKIPILSLFGKPLENIAPLSTFHEEQKLNNRHSPSLINTPYFDNLLIKNTTPTPPSLFNKEQTLNNTYSPSLMNTPYFKKPLKNTTPSSSSNEEQKLNHTPLSNTPYFNKPFKNTTPSSSNEKQKLNHTPLSKTPYFDELIKNVIPLSISDEEQTNNTFSSSLTNTSP